MLTRNAKTEQEETEGTEAETSESDPMAFHPLLCCLCYLLFNVWVLDRQSRPTVGVPSHGWSPVPRPIRRGREGRGFAESPNGARQPAHPAPRLLGGLEGNLTWPVTRKLSGPSVRTCVRKSRSIDVTPKQIVI